MKQRKKTLLIVFGTRPEAIKMIPIYKSFKNNILFNTKLCVTSQHKEMLDSIMNFFDVTPDYNLDVMEKDQSLESLSSKILLKLSFVLDELKPDLIFAQGDTTTSFISALGAFYKKIKIAHIEAGLRTNNMLSPFPEEGNRQLISRIANYHFTPTNIAENNLLNENISNKVIFTVGNSVIDSLLKTLDLIKEKNISFYGFEKFKFSDRKIVLITGHRRENFGDGFLNICEAIKELSSKYKEVDFVYPVHLNPKVQKPVFDILDDIENIYLIKPLGYVEFVYLMDKSYLILTDSGGIQEEAPSLGKPILVMRDTTERPEAIENGNAKLVGTDKDLIISETSKLLENAQMYNDIAIRNNPYGDGDTANKIMKQIELILS
jgi:UDP-N-acetylglucosamine 2-epimerase (non-hydrolysing)